MGPADACAHKKGKEGTALATWLPRQDHPDHKALWPKYRPIILKNSFPGNEINEEPLEESEGNHASCSSAKRAMNPNKR